MFSILVLIIFLIAPSAVFADTPSDPAIEAVTRYGETEGGIESIGSLIDLSMKDWKPQSSRGIEIHGWKSKRMGESLWQVTYSYHEHGRPPVMFVWILDASSREIRPLNKISRRLMKMACLL
ncbi:MAG: hypothetical protein K9K88_03665 [Desulfobacterales bacterium]|nr:hypothetical protein [Desulfobacterales bacterium]